MPKKTIRILVIFSDGSTNILKCREETLQRTIAEAVDIVKIVEPKPLEISVLFEEFGSALGFYSRLCVGCGRRIGNRRAKTDVAYCGRCRRR